MTHVSEYHKPMRRSISAPVAALSALAVALLLTLPALAQVNGPPASVTSPGFGGNAVNGTRSSVTSLGPQGYTPPPVTFSQPGNGVHHRDHDGDNRHHRRQNSDLVGPVWYGVPVPYAVDNAPAEDQSEPAEDDAEYQGGPTVFDRRGSGERSYVPPVKQAAPAHAPERTEAEAPAVEPDPPLPATLLIFKDGHTVEVGNYAIQGPTLFDLTPGHHRKVAIKDLDLEATRRQNDERGVAFELPQSTKVN